MTEALLGLGVGVGLLLVVAGLPALRRLTLTERIAPYVAACGGAPWSLPTRPPSLSGLSAALAGRLDRFLGGRASLQEQLIFAGGRQSVEQFRMRQVLAAAAAALPGALLLGASGVLGQQRLAVVAVGLVITGIAGGVVGVDLALSRQINRREADMLDEFPAIADLLALAVLAGEGLAAALGRVSGASDGELAGELARVRADVRAGTPLVAALDGMARRVRVPAISRFCDTLAVAVERGTPLAGVLRAQAADAREATKRHLLESGGRREIGMMVPVVFLVLPVTVVFAAYPALHSLTFLTR